MKIGDKFGRLRVIRLLPGSSKIKYKAVVVCGCGVEKTVGRNDLVCKKTLSCGCLNKEKTAQRNFKHGHSFRSGISPTYISYIGMKQRCYYPNHDKFSYYGGKGIKVCQRWKKSFVNFLKDMGERPKGLSIDRINSDKNYTPSNCRWATQSQQIINAWKTRRLQCTQQ